ncbi:MAG TPA: Holliday junction resolvase RuvX [Clostridiales bacterium]|nr:Holliday junction resolvase RuvX [Clostridiales bacterium]
MGIDYGDARIGIAISDPFGWTAQVWGQLPNIRGPIHAAREIVSVMQQYKIQKIVMGYPLNMNGTRGQAVEKVEEFIRQLAKLSPVPVIRWDERLSTVSAQRTLTETGIKSKMKKNRIDGMAAQVILQSYLDNRSMQSEIKGGMENET